MPKSTFWEGVGVGVDFGATHLVFEDLSLSGIVYFITQKNPTSESGVFLICFKLTIMHSYLSILDPKLERLH